MRCPNLDCDRVELRLRNYVRNLLQMGKKGLYDALRDHATEGMTSQPYLYVELERVFAVVGSDGGGRRG